MNRSLQDKRYGSRQVKTPVEGGVTLGMNVGNAALNGYGLYQSYVKVKNAPHFIPALANEASNWEAAYIGGYVGAMYTPGTPAHKFWGGALGSMIGVTSKDMIQQMIDGANYNIQKDFVPVEFDMYNPLIGRDNTTTPLTPQ